MIGKKGGNIEKLRKESAGSLQTLTSEVESYLKTLNGIVESQKDLPRLKKKNSGLVESLKNKASEYQALKENYDGVKSEYDEIQQEIKGGFEEDVSSIYGGFYDSLAPVVEGCVLKISGKNFSIEEFFNRSVVEEGDGKISIEPVSAKGLKGILAGKESHEIRSRLDFIRLQIKESRELLGVVRNRRFEKRGRSSRKILQPSLNA